ncbi:hypothetical protein [Gracilibacillus sp. YIM 98692]|uniref:hypothetical protein n=1 Tax=Gracilibacillus sp. YIM 98692 TaxID=2663532 RepID=UPI0013D12022|nr:hypothetical protein [Gracilibacillus sp. YIM 98692]
MKCFCEQKETYNLKIEGDVGADPIWCNKCGCNLDFGEIPVSNELKDELMRWIMKYGEWIDWSKDKFVPHGVELEEKHNQLGRELTEKVKKELGEDYEVIFSSSTMVESYPR